MGLHYFTFYDIIKRNARCFKEKHAWFEVADGKTLTFDDFKNMVDHLATGLQQAGLKQGDRIGLLGRNSLELFLIYGAAFALGSIVVPLNWRLSADEIEYILGDCKPRFIFVDHDFQELIQRIKNKLNFIHNYYNIGVNGGYFTDFSNLLNNKIDLKPADVMTDDACVIFYTAAISGKPRGAIISHDYILSFTTQFCYLYNIAQEDVHLNLLPLFHGLGVYSTMSAFRAGSLNINVNKFDAVNAVNLIQEKKVSILFNFPPILASILEQQEKMRNNISSLKKVAGIDSPETIEKYQRVTGGNFFPLYGQTECMATTGIYNERPGSAGRPLPLMQIRLVDNYDNPVPNGRIGEITAKGPSLFKGYWNQPEVNTFTFRGGWHHTGDIGRFDEDGFLWFVGRKPEKELIKCGGENVYPAEVEEMILQHTAVAKAVVFGVPDSVWGEAIKAVCQLKEGQSLEAQELIDFVAQRIARYKKPHCVIFIENLPSLEDGLPDRAKITKQYG